MKTEKMFKYKLLQKIKQGKIRVWTEVLFVEDSDFL